MYKLFSYKFNNELLKFELLYKKLLLYLSEISLNKIY